MTVEKEWLCINRYKMCKSGSAWRELGTPYYITVYCGLQLLKKEEDCREKPIEIACTQIVDCLVENVLQLEEKAVGK